MAKTAKIRPETEQTPVNWHAKPHRIIENRINMRKSAGIVRKTA